MKGMKDEEESIPIETKLSTPLAEDEHAPHDVHQAHEEALDGIKHRESSDTATPPSLNADPFPGIAVAAHKSLDVETQDRRHRREDHDVHQAQ